MSPISSVETITPSSPLPSSDSLIRETTWSHSEQRKGKQKQTEHKFPASSSDDETRVGNTTAYPPINDNVAETRRVEENLRRWEVAERQRRKLVRESASNVQGSSSLIGGVSRRISELWPDKKKSRHTPNTSLGTHVALQSQENLDGTSSNDTDANPIPSPLFTPTPSPRPSFDMYNQDNPFANPPDESLSPFADSRSPKSSPEGPVGVRQPINVTRIPPTPKPLGLPPPRTPPPPNNNIPQRQSIPSTRPIVADEDEKPTRWWHDWLCGFSEGPDRGGEYQAGRTNPYE